MKTISKIFAALAITAFAGMFFTTGTSDADTITPTRLTYHCTASQNVVQIEA